LVFFVKSKKFPILIQIIGKNKNRLKKNGNIYAISVFDKIKSPKNKTINKITVQIITNV